MGGVTTRRLEGYKKTNSVKDFFKQNQQSVSKEYATVMKAVVSLLSQYEEDSQKEEFERTRNLTRLIIEQHTGMLRDLTKDNDTWKKVRSYVHEKIEQAVKDYFKNNPAYAGMEDEINSAITEALVKYRKKVVSEVSVKEEEQEGLAEEVIRKSVDRALQTKEFKDFQKQLGKKIDKAVDGQVSGKDGLVERYKKTALKCLTKMQKAEAKTEVGGKRKSVGVSTTKGRVSSGVSVLKSSIIVGGRTFQNGKKSQTKRTISAIPLVPRRKDAKTSHQKKVQNIIKRHTARIPKIVSTKIAKTPMSRVRSRVQRTKRMSGTKRILVGSTARSIRKTIRKMTPGKTKKKKSKRKRTLLQPIPLKDRKGTKIARTVVVAQATGFVRNIFRKRKVHGGYVVAKPRTWKRKGVFTLVSPQKKSGRRKSLFGRTIQRKSKAARKTVRTGKSLQLVPKFKTGILSFKRGFNRFYEGMFMKGLRKTIRKFVNVGMMRVLGGVAAIILLPVFGILNLGMRMLKFVGNAIFGVGKAIVSGIRAVWHGISGLFSKTFDIVTGMFSSIYMFMTKNTVGKIITAFVFGTGGFLLGYMVGWLWSSVLKPGMAKIWDFFGGILKFFDDIVSGGGMMDTLGTSLDNIKRGYDTVCGFVGDAFRWFVQFKNDLIENPIFKFASWILGMVSFEGIATFIKAVSTISGGVGGQIARKLPGLWKLVGYAVNGAFRGFKKLFDGREGAKLVLNPKYEDIFGQNVKKADFSSVKDKGKLKSLQDKQMTISHEYERVKVLHRQWNDDILGLLMPEGTDPSRLTDPNYRKEHNIKYTLGDFPRFIEDVLTSNIFGNTIDWGNGNNRKLLYTSTNLDKQRIVIDHILNKRLSVLQDFGNLLSSGDRATLENLASTSMEDNFQYIQDKVLKKEFDPSKVPQVKIQKTDVNATRNLIKENTATIKVGGVEKQYKVGDKINAVSYYQTLQSTGMGFRSQTQKDTSEQRKLQELGGKVEGDFIIVTPELANKMKGAKDVDPKDLEGVKSLSEAISKIQKKKEDENRKMVQAHDRKVVDDIVKGIDLIDFGSNNIIGVFGTNQDMGMNYAR